MQGEANNGSINPLGGNSALRAQELLSRVANREVGALASLYDQLAPTLTGMLMRILSSRADAEGALQEVFLRLWKEAPDLAQTKASVAAWLVLTARHAGFQRLRALRKGAARPAQSFPRQGHKKADKPPEGAVDSAPGDRQSREFLTNRHDSPARFLLAGSVQLWLPRAEDIALAEARLGLLQRAFNQIPKPQRRALELAVFEAYSETEIAAQLGEPLGKVSAGLRAAFTFLRHRQHAVLGTWTADI